ncbi:MAG: hypothetical protein HC802_14335 [Caldilineaceae bacterium]|nr:hypothetical protein [Caldilineaceae bacterium]
MHIAGQPGTFLTSLGPDVLTVLYRGLPTSTVGFGYGATSAANAANDKLLGFVSATTSVGRLFAELALKQIGQFLPPLTAQVVRQPRLIWRGAQTGTLPLSSS